MNANKGDKHMTQQEMRNANKELTEFIWADPNPRGGCYLCHRPLRHGYDAVHLPLTYVERRNHGVAHTDCAKKVGFEVFNEIWGVIKRERV